MREIAGRAFDGKVRVIVVNQKFLYGVLCFGLDDYDDASDAVKALTSKGRVLREQKFSASQEFDARKELLNNLVRIQEKCDRKEKL